MRKMSDQFKLYIDKYEKQYEKMDQMDKKKMQEEEKKDPIKLKVYMQKFFDQQKKQGYWTMCSKSCFRGNEDIFVKIHSKKLAILQDKKHGLPHNHEFFEMVYVYKGSLSNQIDGQEIVQTAHSATLMNPYALHRPQTFSTDDVVFNILFKTETITNTFIQLLSDDNQIIRFFLNSIYGTSHKNNFLSFQLSSDLSHLIQQIIIEWYDQKPMYRQVIMGDVIRLFAGLARDYHEKNEFSYLTTSHDTISQILNYIKLNYATTSIRDIAEQFHCSPSAVSQMLKRKCGKNFSEIMTEFKMESACNYLKNSTLSTQKIVEIVGYNDLSYFYKVFKKNFHISPKEYREKYSIYNQQFTTD